MRTPAALLAAADRAGLRVVSLERVPTADGRWALASLMEFDDPWAAARLLVELSKEDATDPIVREWALTIQKACAEEMGEIGPTRSPQLIACTAAAIQANVQAQILFVHERKETFQSARETIALGAGDCDDHARLVLALALAANIPLSDLVFFEEDDQPVHVAPVMLGEWAETTIAAHFGEHPYEALARLEVETGENPMNASPIDGLGSVLGVPSMGELRDFVAAQKYQLNALADVEGCPAWAAHDPSGYGAWAADLYDAKKELTDAIAYAEGVLAVVPEPAMNVTPNNATTFLTIGAPAPWDRLRDAAHPFVGLASRFINAGYCPWPDMRGMPQPKAPDVDLQAFLWTDTVTKKLEAGTDQGIKYVAIGLVAAVVVLALVKLPRRRSNPRRRAA